MAYDVDDPVQYKDEPTWAQQGVDPPGFVGGFSDFVLYGVYNGAFAKGPPDPAQNLDVTTASGSNFMPAWRFVQSSNTNITAKQVRDVASPSGSNLRFTFASGAANDAAFVEQIADVGGTRSRAVEGILRAFTIAGAGNTASFTRFVQLQYLDVDGNAINSAVESSGTLAAGTSIYTLVDPNVNTASSVLSPTSRLRIRLGVRRGAAATGATGTIDFTDVRHDKAVQYVVLGEGATPGSYAAGRISQSSGVILIDPSGATGGGTGPVGVQIQLSGASDALQVLNGHIETRGVMLPSTQVPSSDVNTLDDYEEGTWTPDASYATVGTSSWAVTTAVGFYTKIGNRVMFNFFYQGVPTNGTAAGNLQITGLPFTSQNTANDQNFAALVMSGYTKAGYTMVAGRIGVASALIIFDASGSGVATGLVVVADVPTGGTVIIKGGGHYQTAT